MAGCGGTPEQKIARYVASADQYAADGKPREAIIEYRNALELDPTDAEIRAKLGKAYMRSGDHANALRELTGAADLRPDNADLQVNAAELLLLASRFEEARTRAEAVLQKDPGHVEAQIVLANAFAGLKDFDTAVAEIEEAIRLEPAKGHAYTSLGAFELGRGRHEPAARAFQKAIELDPKSIRARLALANYYWAMSQWREAESSLLAAREIAPDNPMLSRALATFYLATGRPAEAEPHLKRVFEVTKSPAAALALADFYIWRRDDAAARALLNPLSGQANTRVAAALRLATIDHRGGRKAEAMSQLDSALAEERTHLQGLLLKTSFHLDAGELDAALAVATLAAESHADSATALATLGKVHAARSQVDAAVSAYERALQVNPRATEAKIALARLHLVRGQSGTSLALAQEAMRTEPSNPDARLAFVRASIARGELSDAETELDRLLAAYPETSTIHVQRGLLLGAQRKPAAARLAFAKALELQPDSVDALGGLIALELSEKQVEAARSRVDAWLARPTASAEAVMLGARTYATTGDLVTAERLLRRVINMAPNHLAAYGALGQIYLKQGRLPEARKELEAVVGRDPRPVAALTLLGMILEVQRDESGAREHYRRALEIDPEAAVAANNLAWLYAEDQRANLDVALQLAQTASRRLPDSAEVADTLGYVYYKKQLSAQAIRTLSQSVNKDPRNPTYRYHLGLAYAQAGDTARARDALRAALVLKPDFKGAADANQVLNSLDTGR